MREERISFKEVLTQGMGIYRDNFALLFKFAFISICISLSSNLAKVIGELSKQPALIMLSGLVGFGITIISIYFLGRLVIGMYLSIANIYYDKEVSFSSMYSEGEPKFWTYFGVRLLSGLIYTVPAILMVIGYMIIIFNNSRLGYGGGSNNLGVLIPIAIGLVIIGVIICIIIFYKLSMITPLVILNANEKNHISKSFKLTKGHVYILLPLVLFASLIYGVIFIVQFGVSTMLASSILLNFGITVVISLISAIIQPLVSAMLIITYFNLEEDEHDYIVKEEELVLE